MNDFNLSQFPTPSQGMDRRCGLDRGFRSPRRARGGRVPLLGGALSMVMKIKPGASIRVLTDRDCNAGGEASLVGKDQP
ncbi:MULTISPECIES: hypothetical protein [Nocardioides]|uniref:Uncharacterized protein n=1 Tax=Nocardioides abyssi TaxID=3058370 RepID=A0ABT8EUQ4_9ACTN|nr:MULTISPECIES: hypothetical protein [Nocardioides]MDN4161908.1 hypothetical protein [Nocardioides abyssi]WKN46618.1 hypothetical protein OSR43_11200 [Nocardioides sp. Arc9.136]